MGNQSKDLRLGRVIESHEQVSARLRLGAFRRTLDEAMADLTMIGFQLPAPISFDLNSSQRLLLEGLFTPPEEIHPKLMALSVRITESQSTLLSYDREIESPDLLQTRLRLEDLANSMQESIAEMVMQLLPTEQTQQLQGAPSPPPKESVNDAYASGSTAPPPSTPNCCELSGCSRPVDTDLAYCSHHHGRLALFEESSRQLSPEQLEVIQGGLTLDNLPENQEDLMDMVIELLLKVSAQLI